MKKKHKIIAAVIVVALIVIGCATLLIIRKNTSKGGISGTVTQVVSRPNLAEDGYYGMDVQTDSGQKYTIDATGYLDTPAAPEQFGEACVDVPKVKIGDKVSFNLPRSESQQNTFDICYKKNLSGYYFKLQ